jgi:hypothetical protein
MTEFMMIFRNDYNPSFKPSPEQMQASIKQWQDWIGGIAAQGKFSSTNRLGFEGKTLKPNNVNYGWTICRSKRNCWWLYYCKSSNIDEAMKLAEGCPILILVDT